MNGICVLGDVNFDTGEVNRPVNDVTVTGFTIRGFSDSGIIAVGADNATFSNNVAEDNDEYGITAFTSSGTRMLFNRVSGAHEAGFYIGDSPNADAKLVGNESFDSLFGVLIRNALQGSVVANSVHDNCAAVAVLADAPGPAGLFNVTANRITHNTKSCPASDDFPSDLSAIGVALFGATGVTVAGNTITGNVPGGSTAARGGVVVMTGLGGTAPTNNMVVGNLIVGNDPDLFWDSAGSGNTFKGNRCQTSSPPGLCH